jgi:type II secretory pathway pseudopilin PulG
MHKEKKAQVWLETVLYTLIGLALIGVVLGLVYPKINEAKEKVLVEQSINSLSVLDEKINEAIRWGAGNRREAEFSMKKGELYINSTSNEIMFALLGLSKPYSQPGVEISSGRIKIMTISGQKTNSVYLRIPYSADITYGQKNEVKKFNAAATPYRFFIENKGEAGASVNIDIVEVSGAG